MRHAIYWIAISLRLFNLLTPSRCQCPEHFRYHRNQTVGQMMGIVELPSPPEEVCLRLRVTLSISTILPTKYEGHIELAKDSDRTILSILKNLPISYKVYFDVRYPIPIVTGILLNEVQYCSEPPTPGLVVTSIVLQHSFYPTHMRIPLTENFLERYLASHTSMTVKPSATSSPTLPQPTSSPTTLATSVTSTSGTTTTTTTTSTPALEEPTQSTTTSSRENVTAKAPTNDYQFLHPSDPKLSFDCGLNSELDVDLGEVKSITWPWLAAIFYYYRRKFLCTGILVSEQHVLTVAHCLKGVSTNFLTVSLGRRSVTNHEDDAIKSIDVKVSRIVLHPDYVNSADSADSDLAVIKLVRRVDYTPSIRPICLWMMDEKDLDKVVGINGHVIGWGSDGESELDIFRTSEVSIVPMEECRQKAGMTRVTSNRTFCAKSNDDNGFCKDNSGSGLVMYDAHSNRYHLRGMVSLSLLNVNTRSCDPKECVVYVDVTKYEAWIGEQIA